MVYCPCNSCQPKRRALRRYNPRKTLAQIRREQQRVEEARELRRQGVGIREISRRLRANTRTINKWVAGIEYDWESAVDSLVKNKGYRHKELALILCQKIACKWNIAIHWFAKRRRPPISAQQAIIELDAELPELKWEPAVVSLVKAKGYLKSELARMLCQKIGCKRRTAEKWFGKHHKPPIPAQQAIIELDAELPPKYDIKPDKLTWEAAVDSLVKAKGYKQAELARMLCQKIDCKWGTAAAWVAKRNKPPIPAQQAIIELDAELPPKYGIKPDESAWEPAVDSLVKTKGYSKSELARLLCKKIGCNPRTAQGWFGKGHTPPIPTQQAIIELDEGLPPKTKRYLRRRNPRKTLAQIRREQQRVEEARELYRQGVSIEEIRRRLRTDHSTISKWVSDIEYDWEAAVDSLVKNKGYQQKELALILCQKIACKRNTAVHWFANRRRPPIPAQQAIIELDAELPPKPPGLNWEAAVDSLKNKGYRQKELAHILCQKIDCNWTTAQDWFGKRKKPPAPIQQAIIELDAEIPLKYGIELDELKWETAADSLVKAKGYSLSELARILCQKIDCNWKTALGWFGKRQKPPIPAQQAIIELDAELPELKWEAAVDSLVKAKGYKQAELARMLCQKIDCKWKTAQYWFGKRRKPPISVRHAIIELDKAS